MKNRNFLTNLLTISFGTIIGQGLAFAASPLLTRIYSPEDFGILAVYSSFILILSSVSSLKFEIAIPISKNDEESFSIFTLSFLILCFFSLFVYITINLFYDSILELFHIGRSTNFILFIPIGVFFVGLFQVLNLWAVRKTDFNSLAKSKIFQSAGMVGTQVAVGVVTKGSFGLVLGDLVGRIACCITLGRLLFSDRHKLFKHLTIYSIINASKRYIRLPFVAAPSTFLNSAGLQLPPAIILGCYGASVAGWFGFSYRIISIPLVLVGQSMAQVYLAEVSILLREDPAQIKPLFLKLTKKTFLISLIPSAILIFFSPFLFVFLFGDSWIESGRYAQLLGFMLMVQFVSFPVSQTLNVLEAYSLQFFWDLTRFIFVNGSIYLCFKFELTAYNAILCFVFFMTVFYAIHGFLSYHVICKKTFKKSGEL